MTPHEYAELLRNNPDLVVTDDGSGRNHGHAQPAARPAPAKARPAPTEHDEQVALFQWAAANEGAHPELALMFAIPNGGYRPMITAANLAQEGVRAGVPDILLMCRRGRYGALAIELKRADRSNGPTPVQREWLERLTAHGYLAICCYGAREAINAIQHYIALDERGHA